MPLTVQARLDRDSQRKLERLVRHLGWSSSRVVREGIRLLAACHTEGKTTRIIGLGKFASKVPDLGSNKAHLKNFGK